MKKILITVMAVALCLGLMGGAFAYFSDVETSGSNVFTAGTLDLKVDLISSTHCAADGTVLEGPIAFGERNLTNEVFFNWSDIKPGDEGEATISLHVDNDAWARIVLISTANDDNGINDPEGEAGDHSDGEWKGELPTYLHVTLWRDDGDNVKQADEDFLVGGFQGDNYHYTNDMTLADAFPDIFTQWSDEWCRIPGYLVKCQTEYIGISWYVDSSAGNEIQSDSVSITMSFEVSQKTNQPTTPYTFMGEY